MLLLIFFLFLLGTNWLDNVLSSLESADAKYTEDEMKQRIAIEKELAMFPRLEFGDPEVYKVSMAQR